MIVKFNFKGIGSILFLKNGLKIICRKSYKNHLKSNNYEVCAAVALCFLNILNVMVLEIERPSLWPNNTDVDFCQLVIHVYTDSSVYFYISIAC
jgi:hypothetical protein